jgi:hypothetical protein
MRRLSLNRSEPAKKSGQNIPKNRCRTTIAERMVETPAELPFIGDQVVCLSHNQAARSGPRKEARGVLPGRVGLRRLTAPRFGLADGTNCALHLSTSRPLSADRKRRNDWNGRSRSRRCDAGQQRIIPWL